MAWYRGATRMELQPESDAQPAIRPTQFIVHSIVAPWTAQRLHEYWKGSTLESHFGLGYEGDLAQYIGTETRADANAAANRRPDGTGAVSIETASNTEASDLWTDKQVEQLIRLGVWLHQHHGIPLRICRTHDDPGYGYHRLHREWAVSGTACPGDARVQQFRDVVFPGIVARARASSTPAPAAPPQEETMPHVLSESEPDGPTLTAGTWVELPAARDSAILRGPCVYDVAVGYRLLQTRADKGLRLRFVHVDIETRRRSRALEIDVPTRDRETYVHVSRRGALPAGQYLKVEALAEDGAVVAHRVLDGLYWPA
ncbi:peptidoglycan recognition protein family protein [Streptomyces thermolilacinus]|uniref:peptidoglycan recognition protein family protein n=1 Tax=Streptomyces thermolilacinus TaxID=285540 RepID=UPI0033D2F63A